MSSALSSLFVNAVASVMMSKKKKKFSSYNDVLFERAINEQINIHILRKVFVAEITAI